MIEEEAAESLTKLGMLDKDGNIADEWKDIIVKNPSEKNLTMTLSLLK